MTSITKRYKRLGVLFLVVSLLLNIAPVLTYTIMGFVQADLITEKVTLTATIFVVVILSVIAWANKIVLRSRLWIIILGLYICLDAFITPLIIIAVCQVLDETIVSPIGKRCRGRYVINKQIDKR